MLANRVHTGTSSQMKHPLSRVLKSHRQQLVRHSRAATRAVGERNSSHLFAGLARPHHSGPDPSGVFGSHQGHAAPGQPGRTGGGRSHTGGGTSAQVRSACRHRSSGDLKIFTGAEACAQPQDGRAREGLVELVLGAPFAAGTEPQGRGGLCSMSSVGLATRLCNTKVVVCGQHCLPVLPRQLC